MNIKEDFYCSRCMRKIEDEGLCPFCGYDPELPVSRKVLEEGTLLFNGRYQLGAVLGIGGFGITYAAWDYTLEQAVAVKEYCPQVLADRDIRESSDVFTDEDNRSAYQFGLQRFGREARILSTLQSLKNVVTVFDWFEENNTAYIVMEYVRGQTIDIYIRENNVRPQQLFGMFRELVNSLVSIHGQGVYHRDISPGNIMVEEDGSLKLIDFGASIVEKRRCQGLDQTVMFNRSFAPIEQYDESGEQGAWTDIYALSATMYYLLTGELPQESPGRSRKDKVKPLGAYRLGLKKWQEKAITEGMAVQPDRRIRSMEHFRSVLYHLPMPEEIKRRRRFMLRAGISMAVISFMSILITLNFTYGFYLGDGLRYVLRNDGFHVVGYKGNEPALVIPERRMGIPVSYIDRNSFQGDEFLESVTVPATVKDIGEFAFSNCENLVNVTLNEGVRNLHSQSFGGCSGLQAVIIPDSLENMEYDAFSGASERLVLLGNPDSPAPDMAEEQEVNFAYIEIADNESGITLLKYETHQESASVPDFIDGKPVTQIESGTEKEPVFPSNIYNVTLPDTLEKIGDYAFCGVPISEINLPDTLISIGDYAFSQTQLEEIYIPDSVTYVGEAAFAVCIRLTEARLSPNMTHILSGCFERDIALRNIDIPDGIEEIQNLAFSGCGELESIEIPAGCRIVGAYAFQDCSSLKLVYLPVSLEFMFRSALSGCPNSLVITGYADTYADSFAQNNNYKFYNIAYIVKGDMLVSPSGNLIVKESVKESDTAVMPSYYKDIIVKAVLHAGGLKSRNVVLPEQAETLSTESFAENKYLESVECPKTLAHIGDLTFYGCENLKNIKGLSDSLTEIGSAAFAYCTDLEEIDLPDSVNKIGYAAFENCSNVTDIKIPASMVVLESDTFANTAIQSVIIPGNIVKCEPAFYGCTQLKDAQIDNGVRTLLGTFAECSDLKRVVIPGSVEKISKSTFLNCRNLEDVWIYASDVELNIYSPVTWHIDILRLDSESGNPVYGKVSLEEQEESMYLFCDSPNVTLHGFAGSSVQEYALKYGINFEPISTEGIDTLTDIATARHTDRISESILERVIPFYGDISDHYWGQLQYALGYGLTDIVYDCLDAFETSGDDSDIICARSARLFIEQACKMEPAYTVGAVIGYFADSEEHPTLKAGDIIVAVDGEVFRDAEDIKMIKEKNQSGTWEYTILRPDEDSVLQKMTAEVSKDAPQAALRGITPKTFEE